MRTPTPFLLLLLSAGTMMIASCTKHADIVGDSPQRFTIPDSLLTQLTFDTLRVQPVATELALSGKITFNQDRVVNILPLVSGHVTDVRAQLGDFVEKGTVLAVVRSGDMAAYTNELKASQSELAVARKSMDVASSLRSSGVSSDRDFLAAEGDYQKALAQVNKIREILQIYGSAFTPADSTGSGFSITAPISGFIVDKHIATGMDVRRDDSNTLFTISDLKDVWAVANVFETDIAKFHVGDTADVTTLSYPDKHVQATVERVSNVIDPESNVMSVKLRLPNPAYTLKPGMFARITMRFPERTAMLAVHSNAVIFDDNKSFVLRFHGASDVTMQQVNTYKNVNDVSFIQSDSLHEGDRVIEKGGLFVFTALKKQ